MTLNIINLHHFLRSYFKAYHCQIDHDEAGMLVIQLTKDMDQILMNRPFYWHYIQSMGEKGDPAKLTLITDRNYLDENGELIHFGSPRLQQIFNHLKQTKQHVKLFQKIETNQRTAMQPWLLTNIKVSYHGKQNKEELFSIGLNLINGMMKTNMMKRLKELQLYPTISDYCYPLSPLIKLKSGFIRITNVIEDYLQNQSYEWADEALLALKSEMNIVKHFFDKEVDDIHLQKEMNDLMDLYLPSINYQVMNGGLLYLSENIIKNDS